jgi:WD40 repeat protein
LRENYKAALGLSEYGFEHIEEYPCNSKVELPATGSKSKVNFVLLSRKNLYTSVDKTLYVYKGSDLNSPIATYDLPAKCWTGLTDKNYLFLGGKTSNIFIYEISSSDKKRPLNRKVTIQTKQPVFKIIKLGQELMLGEHTDYLEVFDIQSFEITHTKRFKKDIGFIFDMLAIEDS